MNISHEHPDLRPFLRWITGRHAEQGGLTELRILGGPQGVWSAFIGPGHVEAIASALQPGTVGPHPKVGEAGIYFGLNPISPRTVSGPPHFERVRTTTRDKDIRAFSLFVVDIDAQRSPCDRSASEGEKAHARDVAEAIRAWLQEKGVRALLADSGNGYHLLVPMVPAYGDEVAQAARDTRRLLRVLDGRFSTREARVDTATYNPSRIFKLYGTMAVKGLPSPEHPHRWASIDLSDIPRDEDLFERLNAWMEEEPRRTGFPLMKRSASSPWEGWRAKAVAALPLEAVYGAWLTGASSGPGWLQCRDPDSDSGDQNPSAGVADGTGEAERGSFHSFRTGQTESVFDFLLRQGLAADFRQAAALVAGLAGIPTPDGQSAPWARVRVATGEQRAQQVREAVRDVLALPRAEQRKQLERLHKMAGLEAREVKAIAQELRATQLPETSPRGRPIVDYVINRDAVEDTFERLVQALLPAQRFFRTESEMIFVRRHLGPIRVTERNFGGFVSSLLEVRFLKQTEDGLEFLKFDVLPVHLTRAFVTSPRMQLRLPQLHLYTRSPLFDPNWHFIGQFGYHAPSGVFYDGPEIAPREGCARLCEALADFHWKGEADQVNFVGALLTALTMPSWGRGHPFLAVNGNKPGVGKSTLARVLGVLVEGSEPNTVSYIADEAEFEKQLATRIEAGDRVVVIDNAKTQRAIESAVLERCITDAKLNFRRLGSNTAITRPQNDVLFCLTMNLVQLGADLRRRALPLNLELDANVRQTTYRLGDLVGWVAEHRLELLGELAGMVLAWVTAGKPGCEQPARHSTSQRWAETIDAILRLAGFDGFLTNFEASEHAFDPRYEQMAEIAHKHYLKTPTTAAHWVPVVETILEDRFRDGRGQPRTARAKATIVGSLFTDYLGTIFELGGKHIEVVRKFPEGEHRSPVYGFQVLS